MGDIEPHGSVESKHCIDRSVLCPDDLSLSGRMTVLGVQRLRVTSVNGANQSKPISGVVCHLLSTQEGEKTGLSLVGIVLQMPRCNSVLLPSLRSMHTGSARPFIDHSLAQSEKRCFSFADGTIVPRSGPPLFARSSYFDI